MQEIAESGGETSEAWRSVALGDFKGLAAQFVEEEAAIREWYVANGPVLLFITYSCDRENQGMDDASVDEMERLRAALLYMKGAYNNALAAETSLTLQRKNKAALQECQQAWMAKYAKHHENRLLQCLSEDLQDKRRLVTYIEQN